MSAMAGDHPVADAVAECAKAAQAIAPAINQSVAVVTDSLRWIGRVFGGPLQVAVGMLEDALYALRCRARLRVIEKARERLEAVKAEPIQVPPGFIVPFLDACGDAQEDEIQDLWAALLANAVQDAAAQDPAFVQILRSMSPGDAQALTAFLDAAEPGGVINLGLTLGGPMRLPKERSHLVSLGVLGLQSVASSMMGKHPKTGKPTLATNWVLTITDFGLEFCVAIGIVKKG